MPNVLIHGATGMIGNAFAQSLARSGNHNVYGLARTEEKARALALLEIHPILCKDPINDPQPWVDAAHAARIDTIVDAAGYLQDSLKVFDHVKLYAKQRIETAEREGVLVPQKVGFIYVSGAWVHGNSMKQVSDIDTVGVPSSPTPPVEMVLARPGWEQSFLKAHDVLDVGVVRPTVVYGSNSWILSSQWGPVHQAQIKGASSADIPTIETAWPSFVHVEDVAQGMHLLLEKLPLLNGSGVYPVFDLSTSQENLAEIVKAGARELGYSGKLNFAGPGDHSFMKSMTTSLNVDSSRAKILLGWQPKKVGVMPKIHTYVMAWKADQEQKSKL